MASLWKLAIVVATLGAMLVGASSAEAARLALVIGNDDYQNLPKLRKAVGDAKAVKAAFERLDFSVTYVENVSLPAFVTAVSAFQATIAPGDVVAVHYSGHGVSVGGRNYLVPVDMPQPEQETLVTYLAIDAGILVDQLRDRSASLVFAILDACRDNPFPNTGRSIGSPRGLSRMYAQSGQFVLFSAGPGESALDRLNDEDASDTSVFTRVLLKYLETPGLTLQDLAKATQGEVRRLAATIGHEQFPDYFDRTEGKPVLKASAEAAPALTTERIAADYEAAAAIGTIEAWDFFLDLYKDDGGSFYVALATQAREKLGSVSAAADVEADSGMNAASEGIVASLSPATDNEPPPVVSGPFIDPATLVRLLQEELKRVGCYLGSVDGIWGAGSRRSLAEFARLASVEAPSGEPAAAAPTYGPILAELQSLPERVCPLICGARYDAQGEECVLKVCPAGQHLDPKGECQTERAAATRQRPSSGGGGGSSSGNCFEFKGKTFCE